MDTWKAVLKKLLKKFFDRKPKIFAKGPKMVKKIQISKDSFFRFSEHLECSFAKLVEIYRKEPKNFSHCLKMIENNKTFSEIFFSLR